jgi:UTP:GlnB (protein PII) uridylyltransferase
MIRRMRRPLLGACLCAAALLTGCGHSGAKRSATPQWAERANTVCKADDQKIKLAETLALTGVLFTANTTSHMVDELNALKRVGLLARVPQSFVATEQALDILRTKSDTASLRHADSLLLSAKKAAAAKGVHCSFGAVPLREVR